MSMSIHVRRLVGAILGAMAMWLAASSAMAGPYEDAVMASSPVVFYKMNGYGSGAMVNSVTPGANDGLFGPHPHTLVTNAWPGLPFAGVHNNLVVFDGTGSGYMGNTVLAPFVGNKSFTVEFFAKDLTSHTGTLLNYLFGMGEATASAVNIGVMGTFAPSYQGQIYVIIAGNLAYGPVLGTNWNHLALSYDSSSSGYALYVNGASVITGTQPVTTTGKALWNGRLHDGQFPGLGCMADVSMYSSALSAATISNHYLAAQSTTPKTYREYVLDDAPRYYWTFDGVSTPGIYQTVNQGLAGGGVLYGKISDGVQLPIEGTDNASGLSLGMTATFPGIDSYQCWIAHNYTTSTLNDGIYTNWAIECWVYAEPLGYSIIARTQGGAEFWFGYDAGSIRLVNTSMHSLTSNTWHHIVLASTNSSHSSLIIDGDVAGKTTVNVGYKFDAVSPSFLRIGAWAGNPFKGKIDEFAVYNLDGLTPAQYDAKLAGIAKHYSISPPRGTVISVR
jgi:hypothetical protein